METLKRLARMLPEAAVQLAGRREALAEVRLRANRPVQLVWDGEEALCGETIELDRLREIVSALMDYSYYARESELSQGFFTMNDGCRVGVCGRFAGNRLTDIGSVCVRIAREVHGCADGLMGLIEGETGLRSLLVLSPPGLGKTTLLRDAARQMSLAGHCVGIADERHELAACRMGVPTLDVGPRADVIDGCSRPQAIRELIRSMAPDVIVADEIGTEGDAEALADAVRCGVAVVASAHGASISSAIRRPWLRSVIEGGVIERIVLLGERPGRIVDIKNLDERSAAWKPA